MLRLKSHSLFAMAIVAIMAIAACGEIFGTQDNYLKATIGGEVKEWNGALVNALEVDTINGVLIQAIKTSGLSNLEQINLGLANFDGAGTYTIDLESSNLGTYSYTGTDSTYKSITSSGSIMVSTYENSIMEGTFTLTLVDDQKNSIAVENGSFKVKVVN